MVRLYFYFVTGSLSARFFLLMISHLDLNGALNVYFATGSISTRFFLLMILFLLFIAASDFVSHVTLFCSCVSFYY